MLCTPNGQIVFTGGHPPTLWRTNADGVLENSQTSHQAERRYAGRHFIQHRPEGSGLGQPGLVRFPAHSTSP